LPVVAQIVGVAVPGQLGKITRRMFEAGVNIEVLYSDHDHQLTLVVDDIEKGGQFLKRGRVNRFRSKPGCPEDFMKEKVFDHDQRS
jgi:hypothetical protein